MLRGRIAERDGGHGMLGRRARHAAPWTTWALLVAGLPGLATLADAAPVAVRHPEGVAHGFLAVHDQAGTRIAQGELIQTLRAPHRVQSRLVFRFADGSLSDERVVFTQADVFRLVSYAIVQRGPSFPDAIEASLTRDPDGYTVRSRGRDGAEQSDQGALTLPADVYTGMLGTVLKNLRGGERDPVRMVAFTPRPRILEVPLPAPTSEGVKAGGVARKAALFHLRPRLTGVLGIVAPLIGKRPPSLRYWLLLEDAPTILRFEGPFFGEGPVWRVEFDRPEWSSARTSSEGR